MKRGRGGGDETNDGDSGSEGNSGSDSEDGDGARRHIRQRKQHPGPSRTKASRSSSSPAYAPPAITGAHIATLLQCTLCIDTANLRARHLFDTPLTYPCGHTTCQKHSATTEQGVPGPSSGGGPRSTPKKCCPIGACATAPTRVPPAQQAVHAHSSITLYLPPAVRSTPGIVMPSQDIRVDVAVNKVLSLVAEESSDSTRLDDRSLPHQEKIGEMTLERPTGESGSDRDEHPEPSASRSATSSTQFVRRLKDIMTCEVCLMLFYEPMTLVCGHTFCARCLQRTLDQHGAGCPLCRSPVGGEIRARFHLLDLRDREPPTNKVLLGILLLAFPKEYVARRKAFQEESATVHSGPCNLPLYTKLLAFPGNKSLVNFFEANERLMLRRILNNAPNAEGEVRFGMVLPARLEGQLDHGLGYGTMMRIKSVQLLPDDRSVCEVEAMGRFRVVQTRGLDGYVLARVDMIEDVGILGDPSISSLVTSNGLPFTTGAAPVMTASPSSIPSEPPAPAPIPPPPLPPTESDMTCVIRACSQFVEQLRNDTAPWIVQRLNTSIGDEPSREDLVAWGWWLASLLPLDDHEKAKLLPIRSPELRLRLIAHWIQQLSDQWWYTNGCCIC